MPWRQEAKKDVVSCDKLRGAASRRRYADVRMGKPAPGHAGAALAEFIGEKRPTGGIETSQYPEEKKSNQRFRK